VKEGRLFREKEAKSFCSWPVRGVYGMATSVRLLLEAKIAG
jgi:hypothetical protein